MSNKKEEALVLEGEVVEALKGKFRVKILREGDEGEAQTQTDHEVLAHLAGKLRKNYIKIVPGDKVRVEVSPYDISRGRITYRMKK